MRKMPLLATLGVAVACGCGGGGGGSNPPAPLPLTPPFVAQPLVANAGEDQELAQQSTDQTITLDGGKSFFRATDTTTRAPADVSWSQVSGPVSVTIPGGTAPQVTVPAGAGSLGTFVFRVTVTDTDAGGTTLTDTDDVTLRVKPFIVSPIADRIHIGFSRAGMTAIATPITATTTGTGATGQITFQWTGFDPEPFFKNVTGDASAVIQFESPQLAEVQGLSDGPAILGLWLHSGGYHRFTVTATDGAGARDSEDVIVSFAVPTSGLATVPVNVPVFLNGGLSTADRAWQIVDPPAASIPAAFFLDNARANGTTPAANFTTPVGDQVIWFLPVNEGVYTIIVTRTPPVTPPALPVATSFVYEITAIGTPTATVPTPGFVGDGLRAQLAANPDLGNCGGCHAGQLAFLRDKVTPWLGTLHAMQAELVFDPTNATVQARQKLTDLAPELSRATTGFFLPKPGTSPAANYTARNAGFDDVATGQGVPHVGLDFATLQTRFPETARLTQNQCETCHGPGGLHIGDSEFTSITFNVDACARCHDHEPAQWYRSTHQSVIASPTTRTTCVRCHTAVAAADPVSVAFRYPAPAPSIAVPNEEGRRSTATCATCHEPHDRTFPFQLRVHGDIPLPNGVVIQAGDAGMCVHCHNSRRSFESAIQSRNDPHPALQGDMLAGTNGSEIAGFTYVSSPHAIPTRFVDRNGTPGRLCITCHMAQAPSPGDPRHDFVGEHTFRLRAGGGAAEGRVNEPCTQCHGIAIFDRNRIPGAVYEEFLFNARGDWDGDGVTEFVQDEVAGLMKQLGGTNTSNPLSVDNPFGLASESVDQTALLPRMAKKANPLANGFGVASGAIKLLKQLPASTSSNRLDVPTGPDGDLFFQAAWNYYYVLDDGSYGIHNTGYTVGLLQASIIKLREALGDPPFPGVPYQP